MADGIHHHQQQRRRAAFFAAAICFLLLLLDESSFREELERKQNLRRNTVPSYLHSPSSSNNNTSTEELSIPAGIQLFQDHILPNNASSSAARFANLSSTVFVQNEPHHHHHQKRAISTFSPTEVEVFQVPPPAAAAAAGMAASSLEKFPSNVQLRYHFKKDEATTLPGASRVSGALFFKADGVDEVEASFEGIRLPGLNKLTLFTMAKTSSSSTPAALKTHLGLEFARSNTTLLRGSFGGKRYLEFGNLMPNDKSKQHTSASLEELVPGCLHPVRIDLFLNSSSSAAGSSTLRCFNDSNQDAMVVLEPWREVEVHAARSMEVVGFFSLLSIVETLRIGYLLTNLIPSPQQNSLVSPAAALAPLSLMAFSWLAITDFYVLELLLSAVWHLSASSKGFWTTAVLLKFLQFLICHAPFLVLVFMAGFPNQNHDQVRQQFSNCLTRTQIALIFSLLAFEFVRKSNPLLFALSFCSFWVPQIVHGARSNMDLFTVMTAWEVAELSLARALYPVLAMTTRVLDDLAQIDQFGAHGDVPVYDPLGALLCACWMMVQVAILYSQHRRGPRWFVPRWCLPKKFDYFQHPAPRDTASAVVPECAICMLACNEEEGAEEEKQIMVTPCGHVFHTKCLLPWMQVKLSCPTCRSNLPPFV